MRWVKAKALEEFKLARITGKIGIQSDEGFSERRDWAKQLLAAREQNISTVDVVSKGE